MFCRFSLVILGICEKWLRPERSRSVGAEQGGPTPGARTTESGSRVVEEHPKVCALDVGFGERNWWEGHTPAEFDLSGQQCLRICQRNGFASVQTISNYSGDEVMVA